MAERSASRLLVFLPPHRATAGSGRAALTSSTLVRYVAHDAGPGAQSGETPIALLPKARSVDLVFDTADVFVTAIETPKLSDAKLRLALPNLLEDRLLAEANDSHFAYQAVSGRTGSTTIATAPKLPVAVIDRGLLTRALDVMADIGYRARAAYSAIYTVPAPAAGTLSVRVDGGRDVARTGKHEGFSFEFDGTNPPAALALAVRQLGVKKILAFGADAENLARCAPTLGTAVEVARRDVDLDATESAVNLLQGTFAPGGLFGSLALPKLTRGNLKLPLIYAGAAMTVFLIGMNAYWFKLQSEESALKERTMNAFRSNFPSYTAIPGGGDIGMLSKVTQREMSGLRARAGIASADDFSVLNAQIAQLLTLAPLGSIAGVEYRDAALKVKFKPGTADNPGFQNSLRAQAIQQGLEVRFEAGAARFAPAGG
jgi:general secretion pathway protein L